MTDVKTAVIVGWGQVGQACRDAIETNRLVHGDFNLAGIISRDPARVTRDFREVPVFGFDNFQRLLDNVKVDVAFLCGGSKRDMFGDKEEVDKILGNPSEVDAIVSAGGKALLKLGHGAFFAQFFPVTVDSFDTHPRIADYYDVMDKVGRKNQTLPVISTGWDPGTFSEARMAFDAYAIGDIPQPFYGLSPRGGKSMGHSNALLTIPGVRKAIQYTHAIPETIERARRGEVIPENEKTVTREAILVLERNTPDERARVEPLVRNMKDYFRGYKTTVDFVDDETFDREHADAKQHDGVVIGVGKIGKFTSRHELHCAYESNAHGTTGIMVANARGAYRLWQEGRRGVCISPEIPTTYKNARSIRDLLKRFM